MLDILLDAGLDSVKMLPFLYLAYLLIEWIERTRGSRIEALLAEGSRWGAAVGALLGTIPQCGFSAMAASLYGSGVITLGTLMAVFIATSDEAIPMLLAVPERWPELAMLILIKLCIALAVGLLLDLVVTRVLPSPLRGGFTGKAAAVDAFCAGREVLDVETLGGLKTACILGKAENVPEELELSRLDLQKLFIRLTNA